MNDCFIEYEMTGVRAFSTTRHGGVSTGAYSSFCPTEHGGNNPEDAGKDVEKLRGLLGIDNVVVPHQNHGDRIVRIDDACQHPSLEGVDALVTDSRGICLGVLTADCVPILLSDPVRHVVAAVHSGWRGTVKRILSKAVVFMREEYGSCPSDIEAVIGPCIGLDAFEVGQEVYDAFDEAAFAMEDIAVMYDKWHIDLRKACLMQMESLGVEKILTTEICTFTSHNDWFSARRLGRRCGRILNGIYML